MFALTHFSNFYILRLTIYYLVRLLEVFTWKCLPKRFVNSSKHVNILCHSMKFLRIFYSLAQKNETHNIHNSSSKSDRKKARINGCLAQGIVFYIGKSHSILSPMHRCGAGIVQVSNPSAISEAKTWFSFHLSQCSIHSRFGHINPSWCLNLSNY